MESEIGCTMPWNFGKENMTGISECRTILQYEHFLNEYSLLAMLELRDVIAKTECPLPCNYRAIKPIGKPQSFRERGFFEEYASYGLTLVSTDIEVFTEENIYSFAELVSEMGGSLGLFVGFSFIMFWDVILYSTHFLKTFFSFFH